MCVIVLSAVMVAACAEPANHRLDPAAVAKATGVSQTVALINRSAPHDDFTGAMWCGGALVRSRVVVTAAHCVEGGMGGGLAVVVGADNICRGEPITGERIDVKAIRVAQPKQLDLAALILERDATTPPIAVESGNPDRLVAVGWGRSEEIGPSTCRKRGIQLRPGSDSICAVRGTTMATPLPSEQELCAVPVVGMTENTCIGDSGGPVVAGLDVGEQPRLVALTTWGMGCQPDVAGFYTRLAGLGGWLDAVAR